VTFQLHPQLEADTIPICELSLCRVLLMNNANFPWVILVPARDNITELHQLSEQDYALVTAEIKQLSQSLHAITKADKMNVAALGNMVPQLHIHIIARFKDDAAWPNPVWGHGMATPYDTKTSEGLISLLQRTLTG
jgi:diadenosine tetraphosphate (Ap4A) HIT family hydrolase